MYGQELADELEKRRGTRPNPGTIYPALRELEKNRMVESRNEGRRKLYHLTQLGSEEVVKACEYFCKAYKEIFEEFSQK